jgi:hypothetical protein
MATSNSKNSEFWSGFDLTAQAGILEAGLCLGQAPNSFTSSGKENGICEVPS